MRGSRIPSTVLAVDPLRYMGISRVDTSEWMLYPRIIALEARV